MQVQLELPQFPVRLGWETPLSDEDFERAAIESEWIQLERSKEGDLIVNAPAGGFTGHGNSEVIHQLHAWWKTHKRGRVFDSNTGFFLSDGSSYAPDAAYAAAEQLKGLTSKELARFPRLCPAFVIELVSQSDSRTAVEAKMQDWIANGALVAWLIDPYKKSVTIYEPAKPPVTVTTEIVSGTGPIAGFEFNTADVWSCYEL
jgi:Uma2 family endonuclease